MKENDCKHCILSWADMDCEGECNNCGCLAYGDYLGGDKFICQMPGWIKYLISAYKKKQHDKQAAHQYDGIIEWYERQQDKETAMRQALKEVLLTDKFDGNELFICYEKNCNGNMLCKLDTDSILLDGAMELVCRYEEILAGCDD